MDAGICLAAHGSAHCRGHKVRDAAEVAALLASGSALLAEKPEISLLPARGLGLASKELSARGGDEPWVEIQGLEEAPRCVVATPEPPRSTVWEIPVPHSQTPAAQVRAPIGVGQSVHLIPATVTDFCFVLLKSPLLSQ